jgi:hypothetical protein
MTDRDALARDIRRAVTYAMSTYESLAIADIAMRHIAARAEALKEFNAEAVLMKLRYVARAFPGDKQTRNTLIPAIERALMEPSV